MFFYVKTRLNRTWRPVSMDLEEKMYIDTSFQMFLLKNAFSTCINCVLTELNNRGKRASKSIYRPEKMFAHNTGYSNVKHELWGKSDVLSIISFSNKLINILSHVCI